MRRKKITASKDELRAVTKSLYDLQDLRIKLDGRITRKADGSQMADNGTEVSMTEEAPDILRNFADDIRQLEHKYELIQSNIVKGFTEWKEFLEGVKGCGPKMAAVLITEIDPVKAEYPSKIWQYAGLNPGMVQGKKRKGDNVIATGELVRGDKLTPGFVSPYNKYLKTKLIGVLADCMIKAKDPVYTKFYYDYKNRLEQSERIVQGKDNMWSEESKGHRDMAAKRYMMKMFLVDYWKAIRKANNLPIREPALYSEEYLGKKHHA